MTLLAFSIYDTYVVNDLGAELKAKAPPLISYAMFWIAIATDGISGHVAYILSLSSCKYASLIKMNPTSNDHSK